jgi:hypothetical protein
MYSHLASLTWCPPQSNSLQPYPPCTFHFLPVTEELGNLMAENDGLDADLKKKKNPVLPH